jgi:hypothetical protein
VACSILVPRSAYSPILKMEAIFSFETSVDFQRTIRRHVPEDRTKKQTPWPESTSEVYWPSYHRLSAKLALTFVDRGCCMVSTTDPYGHILGFLDCPENRTLHNHRGENLNSDIIFIINSKVHIFKSNNCYLSYNFYFIWRKLRDSVTLNTEA